MAELQSNAIIDITYFKEVMGISNSTNDTVYIHMINAVSDWVDRYLGYRLIFNTYTDEIYDGYGAKVLNLEHYPVVTFTSILRRSGYGDDATWEALNGSTYQVNEPLGQIVFANKSADAHDVYKMTYTAGYSDSQSGAEPVPEDIKLAVAELVYNMFINRKTNRGVSSERLKNYSINYVGRFVAEDFKDTFNFYKRVFV